MHLATPPIRVTALLPWGPDGQTREERGTIVHLHLPPGGAAGAGVLLNSHGVILPETPLHHLRHGWDGGLWNPHLDPPDHLVQRYPNPHGTPRHLHRGELQGVRVEGVQGTTRWSGTHLMTFSTEPPPDHPADPRHLTSNLCAADGGRLVLAPDTELVWRGATHLGVDPQPQGPGGMRFPPPIRTPKMFHRWRHPVWGSRQEHPATRNPQPTQPPDRPVRCSTRGFGEGETP